MPEDIDGIKAISQAIVEQRGMGMFMQISNLTRMPETKEECDQAPHRHTPMSSLHAWLLLRYTPSLSQVVAGLSWERIPADLPVWIDVWAEHQFSLQRYTDGIHAEFHPEDPAFKIDEEVAPD